MQSFEWMGQKKLTLGLTNKGNVFGLENRRKSSHKIIVVVVQPN
jgi:hypothetical protein